MQSAVIVGGARVAYQMAGDGPAIVMIKNNRRPADLAPARMLVDRFRVFQVHPVGFGASERPEEYAFGSIGEQVCAVLWHHELRAVTQPKLIYVGTADPGWRRFRKLTPVLRGCGCDCLEFDGLDHQIAGPSDDSEVGGRTTVAAIMEWLEGHHPSGW